MCDYEILVPEVHVEHANEYRFGYRVGLIAGVPLKSVDFVSARSFCAYMQGVTDGDEEREFLLKIGVNPEVLQPRLREAVVEHALAGRAESRADVIGGALCGLAVGAVLAFVAWWFV